MSDTKVYDLREIAADSRSFEGKTVTLQGWVRNHRKQKNIGFIEFFDGTVLAPMQIVYDEKVENFVGVQAIRNGAAISATGKLVAGRGGKCAVKPYAVQRLAGGVFDEHIPHADIAVLVRHHHRQRRRRLGGDC